MRTIRSYDEQLQHLVSVGNAVEKAETFDDLKAALTAVVAALVEEKEEIAGIYRLDEPAGPGTNYGPYSGDHLFEDDVRT